MEHPIITKLKNEEPQYHLQWGMPDFPFFFFGKCWHGFLFDWQASNWINTKVAGAGQSSYREYTTGQGQEKRGQWTKNLPALLKRLESPKKTSYKIQIRIYTGPGEKGAQKEAFSLSNEKGASFKHHFVHFLPDLHIKHTGASLHNFAFFFPRGRRILPLIRSYTE